MLASRLLAENLQRRPPVRQEEEEDAGMKLMLFFLWNRKYESLSKTELDDEDDEDPISRQCAVAAERRREAEMRKGKTF